MKRDVLKSVLPLVISLILLIIVAKIGIAKVIDLRSQIAKVESDKAALTEKLNTLTSLSSDLAQNSQLASLALPDKNPALLVINQLKRLSVQYNVNISSIKSGSGGIGSNNLSNLGVTFDLDGLKGDIFAYLKAVGNIAPLTKIEKVKLNENGGLVKASIAVRSYYAPYPTKLPAVTAAVKTLTPDEIKTLTIVVGLTPPQFTQVPPSTAGLKSDPFGQ